MMVPRKVSAVGIARLADAGARVVGRLRHGAGAAVTAHAMAVPVPVAMSAMVEQVHQRTGGKEQIGQNAVQMRAMFRQQEIARDDNEAPKPPASYRPVVADARAVALMVVQIHVFLR